MLTGKSFVFYYNFNNNFCLFFYLLLIFLLASCSSFIVYFFVYSLDGRTTVASFSFFILLILKARSKFIYFYDDFDWLFHGAILAILVSLSKHRQIVRVCYDLHGSLFLSLLNLIKNTLKKIGNSIVHKTVVPMYLLNNEESYSFDIESL